jgi:hypothetical protein
MTVYGCHATHTGLIKRTLPELVMILTLPGMMEEEGGGGWHREGGDDDGSAVLVLWGILAYNIAGI